MNGYFFYAEFPDKKSKRKATRKNLVGNTGVIATYGPWYMRGDYWFKDAVVDGSNTASVQDDYLRDVCIKIGEKQARVVEPSLFRHLDENRNV